MVRRLCSIIGACCMSDRTIEVGFYRPQRSWGKVIFSEACVKNSVRGEVVSQHALQVSRGEVEGSGRGSPGPLDYSSLCAFYYFFYGKKQTCLLTNTVRKK